MSDQLAPPAPPTGQCWDFFDKVYCISLEHRRDRRDLVQAQFESIGLSDRVEFLIGQKHPTDVERGIFLAHLNCLRAGVEAGAQTILVFEDDVIFERFSKQKLGDAIEFMTHHPRWNALFFGCFVTNSRRTKYPSIINIGFRSTMHAYVVSRAFAERLLKIDWPGGCLDDVIRALSDPEIYAVHPAFAFQTNSATDNDAQIRIDRFRRRMGGLRFLQKWNERTNYNWGRLMLLHAVILLGAAGWLLEHFFLRHKG